MLSTLMRHTFRTSLVAGFGLLAQSAIADLYIDQATRDANGNITLSGWSDAPVTGITVNGAAASVSTDTMAEETVYRFEYTGANSDQLTVVAQETTGGTQQAVLDFTSGQAIDNALQIKIDNALIDTFLPTINSGLESTVETINNSPIDFVQPLSTIFYNTTYSITAVSLDALTIDAGFGENNANALTVDSGVNLGNVAIVGEKQSQFCLFGCSSTIRTQPFTVTVSNAGASLSTAIAADNGTLLPESDFSVNLDRDNITTSGLSKLESEILKIIGVVLEYPSIQAPITTYVNDQLTSMLATLTEGLDNENPETNGATASIASLSTSNGQAVAKFGLTPYDNTSVATQFATRLTNGAQTDISDIALSEDEQLALVINDDVINTLLASSIQNTTFGQNGYAIGYDASPLEESLPFVFDSDSWITATVTLDAAPYLAATESDIKAKIDLLRINVLATDLNPLFRDIEFTIEAGLDFEADIALVEYTTETGETAKGLQITNQSDELVATNYGVEFSRFTLYNSLLEATIDNALTQVLQDTIDNLPIIPLDVLATSDIAFTASIDGGEDADVILGVGISQP